MNAFPYLLQTSVLLLALSVGYYLLLRRETFFQANRLLLWFSLMGALLLPLIELPDFRPEPVRRIVRGSIEKIKAAPRRIPLPVLSASSTREIEVGQRVTPSQPLSWPRILAGLYGFVAGVLLIRFLVQLRSLLRLINRSAQEAYEGFRLVTNETIKSPFSFFKWVVLNPMQHTANEQEQILRHERVHVRQWHSLDTLAAEVLCIVFWFNPGAWLFRRLVHQTLEYIADRAVLQEGVDARAYQYNLLKVTLLANSPTISNHFSRSELKNRIAMMNKHPSRWYVWFNYPLLAFVALAVATAFVPSKTIAPPKVLATLQNLAAQHLAKATTEQTKPITGEPDQKPLVGVEQPASPTAIQMEVDTTPTAHSQTRADTTRISTSKYLHYEGNRLYWLVTPKTSFEDLVIIKQELAKYNYSFQLIEVKYDPLYSHITKAEILVRFPKGGNTHSYIGEQDSFVPITSRGGYISITAGISAGGTMNSQSLASSTFSTLKQTAFEDEASANDFYQSHRVDYLVEEGQSIRGNFSGTSYTIMTKNVSLPNVIANGFEVTSDGTFTITDVDRWNNVPFFLDNKPYSIEALTQLTIGKLDRLIVKGQNYTSLKAIFLYTKP